MARICIRGLAASQGVAIGFAQVWQPLIIKRERSDKSVDVETEVTRLQAAIQRAIAQTKEDSHRVLKQTGASSAAIFSAHLQILSDPAYYQLTVETIKTSCVHAETALSMNTEELVSQFLSMDQTYMNQRASDIRDVSRRVYRNLSGMQSRRRPPRAQPAIIIGSDLTPSDAMQAMTYPVVGFATDNSGLTSHFAILARSMGIPTIVCAVNLSSHVQTGIRVIVDGLTGAVIIDPELEELQHYQQLLNTFERSHRSLISLVDSPTMSADGHRIKIHANINSPLDMESVLTNGAEGIGLFRSEFLFLQEALMPTEDTQFNAFRHVVDHMYGRSVTIRTLDLGTDKQPSFHSEFSTYSGIMGNRGIRLCLEHPSLFKTQLRAILRASHYGDVRIMYPMITTLAEVRMANAILAEAKDDLRRDNLPFNRDIQVGIMIETPAAALITDILAKEVDFLSIGTNDLIQYTMACERSNESVSHLYQPYHPAILRLIKKIIDDAREARKPVAVCGELAADTIAVPLLLGLGLSELSMSPVLILQTRNFIKHLDFRQLQELAERALTLSSDDEVSVLIQEKITHLR